jgi:hypothetical protein
LLAASLLYHYDYSETLRSGILFAAVFLYVAWLYWQSKDLRAPLHGLLAWGVLLWLPLVTIGFLRDYWVNPWFQQTLFPAVFVPLLVMTLVGSIARGVRVGSQLYRSNKP